MVTITRQEYEMIMTWLITYDRRHKARKCPFSIVNICKLFNRGVSGKLTESSLAYSYRICKWIINKGNELPKQRSKDNNGSSCPCANLSVEEVIEIAKSVLNDNSNVRS